MKVTQTSASAAMEPRKTSRCVSMIGIADTTMSFLLSISPPKLTRCARLTVQARISVSAWWHGAHGYSYAISRTNYLSWRRRGGLLGKQVKFIRAPDRLGPRTHSELHRHIGY